MGLLQHRRNVVDPYKIAQRVPVIRRVVHKIQKRYAWLFFIGLLLSCTLELLSMVTYVFVEENIVDWSSTTRVSNYEQGALAFYIQAGLSIAFSLEWAVLLAADEHKLAYVLSFPTFINILTCFPMLVCFVGALVNDTWVNTWVPMFLRVWWFYDHILLLLDYPQTAAFMSDLTRDLLRNILSLLSTMLTCVGVFHAVENFTSARVPFFECCYFIVVTFGTIGFGDIVPTSVYSRVAVMIIIVVAIYQFPRFFARLAEIARQRLLTTSFSSSNGRLQHVIVAGSLIDRDVFYFLNEFFSGVRRFTKLRVVLLSNVGFSQETRLFVSSPQYNHRVTLVIGDPANREDLERCDAAFADALFLVSNDRLASSFGDYDTVTKSMAIHQFDANLPQHVMLKREQSSQFLAPFVSSIMEKERLKFTLLGLGAILPGAIPLIINLIRTYDPDEVADVCTSWKSQHEWSMGMEIYTSAPPSSVIGLDFLTVVMEYTNLKVTPIGLLSRADGVVRLNPKLRFVQEEDRLILIAADTLCVDQANYYIGNRRSVMSIEHGMSASFASGSGVGRTFSFTRTFARNLDRSPVRSLTPKQAARELEGKVSNHIILVDLASAQAVPDLSHDAGEEATFFRAADLFNILRPIKQQQNDADIVLLTRFDVSEHFAEMWRETGCDPIIVVKGCGLNISELRACQPCDARTVVVFSSGEGCDPNADAMAILVIFSIHEVTKHMKREVPIVCEVNRLQSLALFPPYYTDDKLSALAEENFAFEPNFIVGNSICTSMIDPALYQTYFNPDLLQIVDTFIYGNGSDAPMSCMAIPTGAETYGDVVKECLSQGLVAIGLHRLIKDDVNEEIHGQRFMFTTPPLSAKVDESDIVYFLT